MRNFALLPVVLACASALGCSSSLGSETDPVHEQAACTGDLMQAMIAGAEPVIARGSVPEELFATTKNHAAPAVLIDGPAIFGAMADLIAEARAEVLIETFVWEDGSEPARTLLDGIARLQARRLAADELAPPVHVRILVDGSTLGLVSPSPGKITKQIARSLDALALDPAEVTWEIGVYEHLSVGNQHAKAVIVDGRSAIVTGANPQSHHAAGTPWHDTGYRFDGDVVLGLLADFDYGWREAGHDDATYATLALEPGLVADEACATMLVTGRKRNANPLNNRTDNTQDQAFLAAFAHARERIRIETPNLNDDHAKGALLDALERGVRVELVLSKGFNEGTQKVPGQGGGNEKNVGELYKELERRGVADACEMLAVRWYSYDGMTAVVGNGARASHTKYTSIDGRVVIVGSANMDTQSWNDAHEINVAVDDSATVAAWDAQVFEADFARGIVAAPCDE